MYGRGRWRKRKEIARIRLPNGDLHLAEIHWKRRASDAKSNQAPATELIVMAKARRDRMVVCVDNDGHGVSLEKRKIYVALAEKVGVRYFGRCEGWSISGHSFLAAGLASARGGSRMRSTGKAGARAARVLDACLVVSPIMNSESERRFRQCPIDPVQVSTLDPNCDPGAGGGARAGSPASCGANCNATASGPNACRKAAKERAGTPCCRCWRPIG